MRSTIISELFIETINILVSKKLDYTEFIYILSSFIIYFLPEFMQKYNFANKVISNKVKLESAIFMPDKEKMLGNFVDNKVEQFIYNYQILMKNNLMELIPIKKNIKELTRGVIIININSVYVPVKIKNTEKLYNPYMIQLCGENTHKTHITIIKSLIELEKSLNTCEICKQKLCKFKSFQKNKTIYLCSIDCLNKWKY